MQVSQRAHIYSRFTQNFLISRPLYVDEMYIVSTDPWNLDIAF